MGKEPVIHVSDVLCPKCRRPLTWCRHRFTRADGYGDWYLDIWCMNCGAVEDKAAERAVHDEYYARLGDILEEMQEIALEHALGADFCAALTREIESREDRGHGPVAGVDHEPVSV